MWFRASLLLLSLALSLFCGDVPAQAAFDHSHALLTEQLKKYSDGCLVHYRKWKQHPEGLNAYIKTLGAVPPAEYNEFTQEEKKAFWINAYNALAVRIVLDHYPIKGTKPYYPAGSFRQIPNVWERSAFKVAGRKVNLYDIEHSIIRREFEDPRMHFAVVCAAKGCPPLKKMAYVAENINKDLDAAAMAYMANPANVEFEPDKRILKVSQLFKWFPLDFTVAAGFTRSTFPPPTDDEIVAAYVFSWVGKDGRLKVPVKEVKVVYLPYDWSLNDADTAVEKAKNPKASR